jgi:hypothetical protein
MNEIAAIAFSTEDRPAPLRPGLVDAEFRPVHRFLARDWNEQPLQPP